jgi:DNA-directed RNA polymerase specialized sigma24 family protein
MTLPPTDSIEGPFLGVARRHSLCDDDAWDALAQGFEIALRHRHRLRPDTAAAWFATVVRHEAMRIRHRRCRDVHLGSTAREPPAAEPEPERWPDPRLPALRVALRQLTPDQRRALILFYAMDASRGDGGRYRRIMRATGWSYTKTNRALTEGRAALRGLLVEDEPVAGSSQRRSTGAAR